MGPLLRTRVRAAQLLGSLRWPQHLASGRLKGEDLRPSHSQVDDASQDLFETSGGEDAATGITSLYLKRRLDTGDPFDRPIPYGEDVSVVFALSASGSDSLSSYHGPTRGFASLALAPELPACGVAAGFKWRPPCLTTPPHLPP